MTCFLLTMLGVLTLAANATALEIAPGRPDAEDAWFRSIAHAETSLGTARSETPLAPAERDAIVDQLRRGAERVRASLMAAVSVDSLRNGPTTDPPPPWRRPGQWGNRFVRATSITSVTLGLAGIVASFYDVSPETRSTMALVAGSVGSVGALFNLLRPRPPAPPPMDPNERIRTLAREMLLADTFGENGKVLREAASELDAIRGAPATSDSAAIALARRYAAVLARAGALLDAQIPHAATIARQSGAYPGFSTSARARFGALADHLDRVSGEWRAQRWLVARSERATLEWLAVRDRP